MAAWPHGSSGHQMNLTMLVNGEGPFSGLGIDIYEDYWAGYKKYRGELTYTSLDGYFDVQEEQGNDIARLKRNYEYWKKTHK